VPAVSVWNGVDPERAKGLVERVGNKGRAAVDQELRLAVARPPEAHRSDSVETWADALKRDPKHGRATQRVFWPCRK
jgi:hypothetical protein